MYPLIYRYIDISMIFLSLPVRCRPRSRTVPWGPAPLRSSHWRLHGWKFGGQAHRWIGGGSRSAGRSARQCRPCCICSLCNWGNSGWASASSRSLGFWSVCWRLFCLWPITLQQLALIFCKPHFSLLLCMPPLQSCVIYTYSYSLGVEIQRNMSPCMKVGVTKYYKKLSDVSTTL